MTTLERSTDLLSRATVLHGDRDFPGLLRLLEKVPRSQLLREPELGFLLSLAAYRMGRDEDAIVMLRRLVKACRSRGRDRLFRRRLNLKGVLLLERGKIKQAARIFEEVLELASTAGDQRLIADATINLAGVAYDRGLWREATMGFYRAMVAYQGIGDRYFIAACHYNLAAACRVTGEYSEASNHHDYAAMSYRLFGSKRDLAKCESERALLYLALRDFRLAEATALRAIERIRDVPSSKLMANALRTIGLVSLETGNLPAARMYLDEALRLADELMIRLLWGEISEDLAVLEGREGNPAAAKEHYACAMKTYERLEATGKISQLQSRCEI